jgi:hypothetical protein
VVRGAGEQGGVTGERGGRRNAGSEQRGGDGSTRLRWWLVGLQVTVRCCELCAVRRVREGRGPQGIKTDFLRSRHKG